MVKTGNRHGEARPDPEEIKSQGRLQGLRRDLVSPEQYFGLLSSRKKNVTTLSKQRELLDEIFDEEKKCRSKESKVPLEGVSFKFLQRLHKFVRDTDGRSFRSITTGDVWRDYLRPLTSQDCSSVAKTLIAKSKSHKLFHKGKGLVGPANIFVSHTWGGSFDELVMSLMRIEASQDFADIKEKRYWIDIVSVNQYHDHNFYDTLETTIAQIRRTVCIICPWKDPEILKRSWCLWEIFCSIEASPEVDVDFVMSLKQEEKLKEELMKDLRNSYSHRVWTYLSKIDSEKAVATFPRDERYIKEKIQNGPGFATINSLVTSCLKNLIAELIHDMIPDLKKENNFRAQINSFRLLKDLDRLVTDPFKSTASADVLTNSQKKEDLDELIRLTGTALTAIRSLRRREYIRNQRQASIQRYRKKKSKK